jgi:spore germination cell wall hydrolase CwlJ-like protein/SH3-like domain-containing protein
MRVKIRPVIGCAVSVAAISMFSSMAVLAASDTEIEDAKWSFTAVANVNTQVNIRAGASTDSAIVGYLPKAATAEVIERGKEWTHIISGGVEGYIKDEFLAYGDEAKRLAGVYGIPGVEVSWDDVNMFSRPDCCSSVLKKAKGGSEYTLLDKEGAWYAVQMDDVTVAYVPAEDVQKTTILEKAIPVETAYGESDGTYTAASWQPEYAEDTAADQGSGASAASGYTADSSAAGTSAADTYTDSSADNTYADTSSYDTTGTDTGASSGTDEPSEETVTTASTDDVSLLAALIYCEAGNQSREGKVAVGAVVMNRIASSSYPGSIREVIYQSGQFSPAISGWLDQVIASGAPSDCYEAAQAALNGENPVPGALYFNTSAGKGTKIGAHWFY